ncbi:hypothetical protein VH441_07930 [Psychrobacter sp. HD31]|uniref:hypothetical protein n=1 Tax=Psychrobacter sp. HD31 TaxID=3112003 RepID=UPI003DA4ECA8
MTQTTKNQNNLNADTALLITQLVDAQVLFVQQWLKDEQNQQQLSLQFLNWLGQKPLRRYLTSAQANEFVNQWWLEYPLNPAMLEDMQVVLDVLVYHPVNAQTKLAMLLDDKQVHKLTNYIASHRNQRNALIHAMLGHQAFTDMLTKTLYHAMDDFTETTLKKAGGVGKLMKMGRDQFERVTRNNLDEKLQAYLYNNISKLTKRTEHIAQNHLTDDEVARLLQAGWQSIKNEPISSLQSYLTDKSVEHLIDSLNTSYEGLRQSDYLKVLIQVAIEAWFNKRGNHSLAELAQICHIDQLGFHTALPMLRPLLNDIADSDWLIATLKEVIGKFYQQQGIQQLLAK